MSTDTPQPPSTGATGTLILVLAWLGVGLPMLWGVLITVKKAALLFR